MLPQRDAKLRSFVQKYLYWEGVKIQAAAKTAIHQKDIENYLKYKGEEEINLIIQKDTPVTIVHKSVIKFLLKDDAAATIRRKIDASLIKSVIYTKETVDIEQIQKLVEMKKIDESILDEIMKTEQSYHFDIIVKDK